MIGAKDYDDSLESEKSLSGSFPRLIKELWDIFLCSCFLFRLGISSRKHLVKTNELYETNDFSIHDYILCVIISITTVYIISNSFINVIIITIMIIIGTFMIIIANITITIIITAPFNRIPDGRPENKDALGNVTWNLFSLWCPSTPWWPTDQESELVITSGARVVITLPSASLGNSSAEAHT